MGDVCVERTFMSGFKGLASPFFGCYAMFVLLFHLLLFEDTERKSLLVDCAFILDFSDSRTVRK
jgi:hypothetical protein